MCAKTSLWLGLEDAQAVMGGRVPRTRLSQCVLKELLPQRRAAEHPAPLRPPVPFLPAHAQTLTGLHPRSILPSHSTQQPLHINVEYLNHITLKVTKIAACVGHPHDPQTLRGWTTVLGFGEMTLWGQTTERTRYVFLLLFPPPPNMVVASAFCSWGNKHREGRGRDATSLRALEFTGAGKVPFWLQTWTRWRPMVLQEQWGWFGGKSSDMSAGLRGCLLHLLSALWAPKSRRGPLPN